jgi:hypothetical protein
VATSYWQAGVTANEFRAIQKDPRLPPLLALARLSNAMSIAHHGLGTSLKWQSPRAIKERTSAFLYVAGMLHEGLILAESLGKHFRDLPQYREEFATILSDQNVRTLRTRYLKPLRNQAVFHFDRDAAAAALAQIDVESDVIFLTGGEPNAAGVYFNLADDLAIRHLIGEFKDQERFLTELEAFMTQTTALFKRFTKATQRLIPAAFRQLGARRLRPRNAGVVAARPNGR